MDKAGDVQLLVIEFQSGIIYKHIIANINYTYSLAVKFPKYIKKTTCNKYAVAVDSLHLLANTLIICYLYESQW